MKRTNVLFFKQVVLKHVLYYRRFEYRGYVIQHETNECDVLKTGGNNLRFEYPGYVI